MIISDANFNVNMKPRLILALLALISTSALAQERFLRVP